ncbi:MAG: hypothetical protein Q9220_003141 [cf. Caloplaca sp. 1 TL-2023]
MSNPSSVPLSPQDRASSSYPPLSQHLNWTLEREARLIYVQAQLKAAQAAWSEDQDLWIDEVIHLEDLKRKCTKAERKAAPRGRATSVTSILKSRSWGSKAKAPPGKDSGETSPEATDNNENEVEIDANGLQKVCHPFPISHRLSEKEVSIRSRRVEFFKLLQQCPMKLVDVHADIFPNHSNRHPPAYLDLSGG